MATLKELREIHLQKLKKLKQLGLEPYPARTKKEFDNAYVQQNYAQLEGKIVSVAGRITSFREHGGLVFIDITDQSGKLQVYVKKDSLHETSAEKQTIGFDELYLLDVGDHIEVTGAVTKTKTGEISIQPGGIRMLSKSLRSLPEELKDKEIRLRRRYVDTKVNKEVFDRFVRRARFWEAHRNFFNSRGFLEINIPVLENIPGGADATPFVTHMDAIDQDFFLRISQELYLKRLIGGGYEKVYEIGPRFRNEGLSDEHLPEHIAMEFYWAYASWEEGMKLIQELYNYILDEVYGGRRKFTIRGYDVDFSGEWEILDFAHIMEEKYGIDVHDTSAEEVSAICKKHGMEGNTTENLHRGIDTLWKNLRKEIAGPAFLINHPKYLSPLSKAKAEEPHITERFQPIIAGSELGNGWSEINDPLDQLERFREQQNLRDEGDAEAQWLDIDYVEMLEYGMPPTFGYGHSERVFWFLEDVSAREGVPFPQLKHAVDDTTLDIYDLPRPVDSQAGAKTAKADTSIIADDGVLPSRDEAEKLLEKHVGDEYQKLHAKMVARVLEKYASETGEDTELWYITGLLHDLDYFEHPDGHPAKELEWFKEKGYPQQLMHAVAAHAHERTGEEPRTSLAAALVATDELSGLLYAYSLMRPEGFEGMNAGSVKKKYKDKAFARNVDREDVAYGLEKFGVDFDAHVNLMLSVFQEMKELKK